MHTRSSRKEYALKIINKSKCQGREQMIENEVCILRRVQHPNIIQLVEDVETPTELYLVMELVKVRPSYTGSFTIGNVNGMLTLTL